MIISICVNLIIIIIIIIKSYKRRVLNVFFLSFLTHASSVSGLCTVTLPRKQILAEFELWCDLNLSQRTSSLHDSFTDKVTYR
jgi:hypothetical protein